MDENQQTNNPATSSQGLVPSLKQTWESAKSPIAFLAIGFIIGYYVKGKKSS